MKRKFVCLLFLTAISTYANAQEIPVGEWFAGYSYMGFLSIIARVPKWTTKAVPSNCAPKAPPI
jgi:hypothetical protein